MDRCCMDGTGSEAAPTDAIAIPDSVRQGGGCTAAFLLALFVAVTERPPLTASSKNHVSSEERE